MRAPAGAHAIKPPLTSKLLGSITFCRCFGRSRVRSRSVQLIMQRLTLQIWQVVRNLISPWTASKISVSSGIPEDLLHTLGFRLHGYRCNVSFAALWQHHISEDMMQPCCDSGGPTSPAAIQFQQLIARPCQPSSCKLRVGGAVQCRSPEDAARLTTILRPPGQVPPFLCPGSRHAALPRRHRSRRRPCPQLRTALWPRKPAHCGLGRHASIPNFLCCSSVLFPPHIFPSLHKSC